MGYHLIIVGAIMGFLIAILRKLPPKVEKRTPPEPDYKRLLYHYIRDYHLKRPILRRTVERRPFSARYHFRTPIDSRILPPSSTDRPLWPRLQRTRKEKGNEKFLVENWRRSIIGLVRLADKNVRIAEEHYLKIGNYRRAVEVAFVGVENISRALIHCYGGKPDPGTGQEEVLKLIAQRLSKDEKADFEKAIDKIVHIIHCKTSLPYQVQYISTHNVQIRILEEAETKKILESASDVVSLFKGIIVDHFVAEIPELDEMCPKCQSLSVSVSSFNENKVNYECRRCRHKWSELRSNYYLKQG